MDLQVVARNSIQVSSSRDVSASVSYALEPLQNSIVPPLS
jgi:hypothetical protein